MAAVRKKLHAHKVVGARFKVSAR